MTKLLVAGAIAWPLLLGATICRHAAYATPGWTVGVDAISSVICHRRPERSFQTAGVQWPVCARCSGLYFAAPVGAFLALTPVRRRIADGRRLRWLFVIAAVPTALTLGAEWAHLAAPSNLARAIAAVPLGAALAFILIRVTQTDRVN